MYYMNIYIKSLLDKELGKVKFSNKVGSKHQKEKFLPLLVTYYPILKNTTSIIRKKHISFE